MEVTLANFQLEFNARLNSGLLYLDWNLTFQFTITEIKDFDGYHSTGISPDIYIEQSIEDFKKGKDTVLEYVKELIK